jgi:hypothetical protein
MNKGFQIKQIRSVMFGLRYLQHIRPVCTSGSVKRRLSSNYRSVLCAVDCSSAAVPAIRWAGWLARRDHARLKLVHVIPGMDEKSNNRGEVELRNFTRRVTAEFAVLLDQAGSRLEFCTFRAWTRA